MEDDENGNGGFEDEEREINYILKRLGRQPVRTPAEERAILREKLFQVGRDVIGIKTTLQALWDDYQRRQGERAVYRLWLSFITVLVSALAVWVAYLQLTRPH